MKFNKLFNVIILAACFALPVRAGIISGTVYTAAGLGLGLKAWEQFNNAQGIEKYKSEAKNFFFPSDNKFIQAVNEVEKSLNSQFGNKTTTIVYGAGSAVCILYGIKKILL